MKNMMRVFCFALMLAGWSRADVIYQEAFDNPLSDSPITNVSWNAYVGSSAAVYTGSDYTAGPIVSGGDFMFAATSDKWLAWTDEVSFGQFSSLTAISMKLRNNSASEDLQVAIKVNGSWYVSQEVFSGADYETFSLDVQSAAWNSLTVSPGTSLAEGVSAGALSGNVEAVGVYDSVQVDRVRIDDFTVEAIPEPASIGLFAISSGVVLLVRRMVL